MEFNNHHQLMLFIIALMPSLILSSGEDLSVCATRTCTIGPSDCPEVLNGCEQLSQCDGLLTPGSGIMNYSCFGHTSRNVDGLVQTVQTDGYEVVTHYVTTSDGYIITIFRIKNPACTIDGSKKPMLLAHGLFLGAYFWLAPIRNHAYVYADKCYDVWLINVRGNTYGRNHTTKNPDTDFSFWDFDFDEMALYDLPAIIDYVLVVTGQTQVIYIAHSQGATIFYVLLSMKPEYNDKVYCMFAMSSTAYLNHATMPVLEVGQLTTLPVGLLVELGYNVEILKQGGLLQVTAQVGCGSTPITFPVCTVFVFFFFGYNKCQITCQVLMDVVHMAPQGTSLKLFQRWNVIKQTEFTQRDEGFLNYGRATPPEYPLQNIRAPMIFFISCGDNVSTWQDMQKFFTKLTPGVYQYCLLKDTCFSHIDFLLGKDFESYVADPILTYLENGNLICN